MAHSQWAGRRSLASVQQNDKIERVKMSPPAKRPAWQVHLNKRARGLATRAGRRHRRRRAATLCNLGEGRSSPCQGRGNSGQFYTDFIREQAHDRFDRGTSAFDRGAGAQCPAFNLLKKRPTPFYLQL